MVNKLVHLDADSEITKELSSAVPKDSYVATYVAIFYLMQYKELQSVATYHSYVRS